MERYLLFDSGCTICSKTAKAIEQEANGRLTVRSLRDSKIQSILDEVKLGWQWEPMLLELDDKKTRVYSGLQMRMQMVKVLGLRRAFRVATIVQKAVQPIHINQADRRSLLRYAGGLVTGLAVLGVTSQKSHAKVPASLAQSSSGDTIYLPMISRGVAPLTVTEAKQALSLLFNSSELAELQNKKQLLLPSLNTPPQTLERIQHVDGEFYGAESVAVAFVGEKDGHRVSKVYIGSTDTNSDSQSTLLIGIIDTTEQKVIDIFHFDITAEQTVNAANTGDGISKIAMHTSSGRFESVMENGQITAKLGEAVIASDWCDFWAGMLCWTGGLIACTLECGAICFVTAGIACSACGYICGLIFAGIGTQCGCD